MEKTYPYYKFGAPGESVKLVKVTLPASVPDPPSRLFSRLAFEVFGDTPTPITIRWVEPSLSLDFPIKLTPLDLGVILSGTQPEPKNVSPPPVFEMRKFTEFDGGDLRLKALELRDNLGHVQDPDQIIRSLRYPNQGLSVEHLCAACQNNCTLDSIKFYLQSFQNTHNFQESVSEHCWPALYYAVERNSVELVSLLLSQGCDPQKRHPDFKIPLLAFAIIHGYREAVDTSEVVRVLLAAGVNPKVIPMDMWSKFVDSPLEIAPAGSTSNEYENSESSWCEPAFRRLLAKSLHLTQRYLLNLSFQLKDSNPRTIQIAKANKMTELGKLPYFLVGQRPAASLVMKSLYSYVALKAKGPLVMAFAGPSGHGKTELALALGNLLSVETTVIDCAGLHSKFHFFGPSMGYAGYQTGSQLNNFLAEHNGFRSIVFLDEFDKTNQDIRNALLLITEKGEYQDRRDGTTVDCSKTVWILATNLGDDKITAYYDKHLQNMPDEKLAKADMKPLQNELKRIYRHAFGAPFTGRINQLVPFLPFTAMERPVVLHKFLLRFATQIRLPIDLSPNVNRLIGHCRLTLIEDGNVCVELSEQYYNKDLGARSLQNAAKDIESQFVSEYTDVGHEVTESINDGPLQSFFVRRVPMGEDSYDVGVYPGTFEGDSEKEDGGSNLSDDEDYGEPTLSTKLSDDEDYVGPEDLSDDEGYVLK